MLTSLLPEFTPAQLGLVSRLLNTDRATLTQVLCESGHAVTSRMGKVDLIRLILRQVAEARVQDRLLAYGLARYVWFGQDLPLAVAEAD